MGNCRRSGNSGEGEGGWFFDEIGNLVEPTERPHMGEQHCGERRHRKCRPVRERSRIA
jgi:hypothetical protein